MPDNEQTTLKLLPGMSVTVRVITGRHATL